MKLSGLAEKSAFWKLHCMKTTPQKQLVSGDLQHAQTVQLTVEQKACSNVSDVQSLAQISHCKLDAICIRIQGKT